MNSTTLLRTTALFGGAIFLIVALALGWLLRPQFIPNWAAPALDSAAAGDCARAEHILSEVTKAGVGDVRKTAEQMNELGFCPNILPAAFGADDDKPVWFTWGGPVFDPEFGPLNRGTMLSPSWWSGQVAYMRCWRRFDPEYRVDVARILHAIADDDDTGSSSWNDRRAACAQQLYDDTYAFLGSEGFNFEKGQSAYRLLGRAEYLGHAMSTFVRGTMLINNDWRFRKVDHEDTDGYDALYRAAVMGYPPAEKELAIALADRDDIRLPDEQTYYWLVRAWQSWDAYDWELELYLKDYSNRMKADFPPDPIPAVELKEKSENRPIEHR